VFAYNAATAIRKTAGTQCTVAVFLVICANTLVRMVMPEELGGMGDFRARVEARVATGESAIEAGVKVRTIFKLQ
jgi:hypothetical protein